MADQDSTAPADRTVTVFVRDRAGQPLHGAGIVFKTDGEPAGDVPAETSEGRGSIQVGNRIAVVEVAATYGRTVKTATLAQDVDVFTFSFDVDQGGTFMEKHVPLLLGLLLLATAIVLAFTFDHPTQLQARIILAVASLGGGGVAAEIPGMLKLDITFGQKVILGATGALAVFVLLYRFGPGDLREEPSTVTTTTTLAAP